MLRLEHVAWDLPGGSAIIKDINLQLDVSNWGTDANS